MASALPTFAQTLPVRIVPVHPTITHSNRSPVVAVTAQIPGGTVATLQITPDMTRPRWTDFGQPVLCPQARKVEFSVPIGGPRALLPHLFFRIKVETPNVTPRMFYARNYGGKCLDFGSPPQSTGGPVFLYSRNGTIAQQIRVEEINSRHEVRLHLGSQVLGVKQPLVNRTGGLASTASLRANIPLELQNEADLNTAFSRTQIFALDGDSIIWAANRDWVVKPQNGRGADRTPLIVGHRQLSDDEFWDFEATDGSSARPTRGFVRVPQDKPFAKAYWEAGWGSVIEIDSGESINMQDYLGLPIPAGVTIRGDRRGVSIGPELRQPQLAGGALFQILGDDVRITGLRLRGPSRSRDADQPYMSGIQAPDHFVRTLIDHNDLSDWTDGTIEVLGEHPGEFGCDADVPPSARPQNVRIVRNFIHDNQREGGGYGVVLGSGAYAYIEGNTFLRNRHAIAADGTLLNSYSALFNLVLADAPCYGFLCHNHEQDFDMHGSDRSSHHTGGSAGSAVDIERNTFLGTNRRNFDLRGQSCGVNRFRDNISCQGEDDAIRWFVPSSPFSVSGDQVSPPSTPPTWLAIDNNQFDAPNPTGHLAVGDFDGDGREDLFLATGAAWYYASAGVAEWRLLSAQTDKIDNLMFGDFDGDGRTDVFTQHGFNWDVSWGGRSRWETINVSWNILGSSVIGDFDGDHRADVFYADGQHWYISYGGNSQFTLVNDSSFRVPDLRFGDFNGDGNTDVFGIVSKYWQVSYSATGGWSPLQPKLTDSVANLLVADFDGDGRADVATISLASSFNLVWRVSHGGKAGWTNLRSDPMGVKMAGLGRFDGNRSADLLLWHDDYLDIAPGGAGAAQRQSRQNMR